jgi:hypothetical protein
MKNTNRRNQRYSEIYRTPDPGDVLTATKALPGKATVRNEAIELHNHLRAATYQLIGIGNALRRVASDFSALDGSNWRNNRMVSSEVQAVAAKLYKLDVNDYHAVIELERELEAIVAKSQTGNEE